QSLPVPRSRVPGDGPVEAFGQRRGGSKSEEFLGPADVQTSARLAVRLVGIEQNAAVKANLAGDKRGQIGNGYLSTRTNVDRLRRIQMLRGQNNGAGSVLDVEKLPRRAPGAPDNDFALAPLLGFEAFAYERPTHVRCI